MSEEKKTWLGRLIQSILDVFATKWPDFVTSLWRKVPEELKEKLNLVVEVVNNIKKFVDSPTADLITDIIPGEIDDHLKDWLRKVLPIILDKYNVVNQTVLNPEESHLIATELTKELTGLSFGQSALTIEVAYQNS